MRAFVRRIGQALGRVPGLLWVAIFLVAMFLLLALQLGNFDRDEWIVSLGSNIVVLIFTILVVQVWLKSHEHRRRSRTALNVLYGPFEELCSTINVTASANTNPKSGWPPEEVRKMWVRAAEHLDQNLGYIANDLNSDTRNSLRVLKDLVHEILEDGPPNELIGGICVGQNARMILMVMKDINRTLGGHPVPSLFEGAERSVRQLEE